MKPGLHPRTVAAWALTFCLVMTLALPQTAEAWVFGPSTRDQVRSVEEVETVGVVTIWARIWTMLGNLWGGSSVLIVPDLTGCGEEEEDDDQQGNQGCNSSSNSGT